LIVGNAAPVKLAAFASNWTVEVSGEYGGVLEIADPLSDDVKPL